MEVRKLAVATVSALNAIIKAAEDGIADIEELLSADDGDGKDKGGEKERGSRDRGGKSGERESSRGSSRGSSRDRDAKDKEPATEKQIVSATRAALKILEEEDVAEIIEKHGDGAKKATEVEPEFRQDVIDALDKAMDEANKD